MIVKSTLLLLEQVQISQPDCTQVKCKYGCNTLEVIELWWRFNIFSK